MWGSKNMPKSNTPALACFDLDGTIFRGQSQRMLLEVLREHGYVSFPTHVSLVAWFVLYKLGILRKPERIMRIAYSAFRGYSVDEIAPIADETVDRLMHHTLAPVLERLQAHQHAGDDVIIVTNTINLIAERIAKRLGVSEYFCSVLAVQNGKYSGVLENTQYGSAKVHALEAYREHAEKRATLYVYADHDSDRQLLELADHAVVVNPSPSLQASALSKGWEVLQTE